MATTNDYRPGRILLAFAAIVCLLYGLMAVIGSWTPRLGLDLRGGTTITLTAVTSSGGSNIPKSNLDMARNIIQKRVDSLGVGESSVTIQGNNQIEVAVPNVSSDELVKLVGSTARLSFRPVLATQAVQSPTPSPSPGASASSSPDASATSGATSSPADSSGATVAAPTQTAAPASPAASATDTATPAPASTAQRRPVPALPTEPPAPPTPRPTTPAANQPSLSQKLAYTPTAQDAQDFYAFKCGDSFPDVSDQPLIACSQDGTSKYFLGPEIIAGDMVTNATAGVPQGQVSWVVSLSFNAAGSQTFADATQALAANQSPKNQFAIVLDGQVVSAPSVSQQISGGQAQISGGSITQSSAQSLAATLRFGALPINLQTSSVDTVSPTLGGNQMTAGIIAGIIGLLLVVAYSLIYYRGLTVVVIGSLVTAAIITYAIMVLLGSAVGFALNLPGIAGAIVAIGVTADSFIVYFERIRDEIRDGHSLRHSIESGWRKARNTILMADGVQLLAAVVLYVLAFGSVKGFAFTLGITTAIDLFLVVFFTHPLMTILGRTAFYGEGHRWSGFDPEHLGVSRVSMLGRRASTRRRTRPDAAPASSPASNATKETVDE